MSIISLKNVSKNYGKTKALDSLDLQVEPGQIVGFIGPNGAGKTTTIRIILGLIKSSGQAEVLGMDPWKDAVEIHKNLSYVSGDVNLWSNLTGGEVIDFFLRLKGQDKSSRKDELIEKFNLDPSKKCGTYSKGNRQKIALIAALACDVDLYIFDEPTSGLDPLMEKIFQDEIYKLKDQGKTILLSSHILSEVEKLCDTISIIKDGKQIESGPLESMRHLTRTKVKVKTEDKIPNLENDQRLHDYREKDGTVEFSVDGENLGQVIDYISNYKIISLVCTEPTLEDLFMSHYERNNSHE